MMQATGGNMDNRRIGKGATMFFPVEVGATQWVDARLWLAWGCVSRYMSVVATARRTLYAAYIPCTSVRQQACWL